MKASQKCINLIKEFEGCYLNAYLDPVGIWTIGYGHTAGVYPGQTITQVQAENMLKQDLVIYENAVNNAVKIKINQNQFDALTSFSYNVGVGAMSSSTLIQKLNAGNIQGAADEFMLWVHGNGAVLPGLVRRRQAEKNLFLSKDLSEEEDEVKFEQLNKYVVKPNQLGVVVTTRDAKLYEQANLNSKVVNTLAKGTGWVVSGRQGAYFSIGGLLHSEDVVWKVNGYAISGSAIGCVVKAASGTVALWEQAGNKGKVVNNINNTNAYRVVGEQKINGELYVNIGGWAKLDAFNIRV